MGSSEFALKKIKRKVQQDGIKESLVAAGDLLTRKRLGRPVFDQLTECNIVGTISRDELQERSSQTSQIPKLSNNQSDPFVSLLERGWILSETGLVLTEDLEIVRESAAAPNQAKQAMMAMLSRELFYGESIQDIFKSVIYSTDATQGSASALAPVIPRYPNYYHWMIETVPKIRYLRMFEEGISQNVSILIPSNAPRFVDTTLQLLEWPRSRVKYATQPVYHVQDLVLPSFPKYSQADFKWIRQSILQNPPSKSKSKKDMNNIYISRSNAIERQVLNEAEVMNVLSAYNFSCYELENRSLEANAKLFNSADMIVGPHGAGLSDIIFAEDCTVIELFGNKIKPHYQEIAEVVDLEYEAVYGTPKSSDILVDTDKLEVTISNYIS